MTRSLGWTGWVDLLAPEHWQVYQRVMQEATHRGIKFALAGAFATATHTGRFRDTNDLVFYILPDEREEVMRLTQQIGLRDFYDECPYDRSRTYRATDGKVILEAIWTMRNHRASVDAEWLERSLGSGGSLDESAHRASRGNDLAQAVRDHAGAMRLAGYLELLLRLRGRP